MRERERERESKTKTHNYTHTHTHTLSLALSRSFSLPLSRSLSLAPSLSLPLSHSLSLAPSLSIAHKRASTCSLSLTDTDTDTDTDTHTHTHTCRISKSNMGTRTWRPTRHAPLRAAPGSSMDVRATSGAKCCCSKATTARRTCGAGCNNHRPINCTSRDSSFPSSHAALFSRTLWCPLSASLRSAARRARESS